MAAAVGLRICNTFSPGTLPRRYLGPILLADQQLAAICGTTAQWEGGQYMRGNPIRTGACLVVLLFATIAGFAEVTDLQVSRSGTDVALEWTTGASPYRVIRSLTAVFMSGNAGVAEGIVTGRATDPEALAAAESYFYQVLGADEPNPPLFDLNPPYPVPVISTLTPASGQPGTRVKIDGINLPDYGNRQIVMFGDQEADVRFSTPTQIIAIVPPGTSTSDVVVCSFEVCSNKARFTVTFGTPEPGTVEWALAVEAAREEASKKPRTPEMLVSRYRRLLDLHKGCTGCRAELYQDLEDSLRHYFQDQNAIDRIKEEEYANNEVELAKHLWQTGRADEARRVALQALQALQGVRLVERRVALQWVLIRIHQQRGEMVEADALERRVAVEEPVAPDSCPVDPDRSLEEEQLAAGLDLSDFRRELDQLQDLVRERTGNASVACFYNSELVNIRDAVRRGVGTAGLSANELASLFPQGIAPVQSELASGVSDPDVRAALLLSAAHGYLREPPEPETAIELLREAEGASRSPRVRVAVLRERLRASWMAGRQDEARKLALTLRTEFPWYHATCEVCEQPPNFESASEWVRGCERVTKECFEPTRGWKQAIGALPRGSEAALEELLDSDPPDEVVPAILLKLSDEVQAADPERSLELEQQAIRHPQFPGLPRGGYERQWRAEQREDFNTALFLALVWPPWRVGGSCVPGVKVFRGHEFRVAYYKLRLGMEMEMQWRTLLDLLSDGPEPERASGFYRVENLDVLVRAAKAAHKESEAVAWLEALRRRYQEARRNLGPSTFGSGGPGSLATALREMELVLTGYIGELDASR